ncbi:MAG: tetratricopeptide repeat protein [Acidobacteria bacterium]|nr:tetratricopeptide repeat protein [Acidobacteriota bacterium]
MSGRKAALISCLIALVLGGGLWLGLTRKAPPEKAAAPAVPPSPVHEKAALEEQLRKSPGHTPVLLKLAQLELGQGEAASARKRLEEILKAESGNLDARLELGRACYETDDLPCAIEQTEYILKAQPDNVDALYNMGAIYANTKHPEKARELWNRAVKTAPDSPSGKKAAAALKQLGG